MSDLDDLQDDNQFDDGDGGDDTGTGSGSDNSAPPVTGQSDDTANSQKRLNDLMSRAQRAEAEANRLRKLIPADKGDSTSADDTKTDAAPAKSGEVDQWAALLRNQAQEVLYNSEPRFAKYGIDKSVINGDTPEAMQASLEAKRKELDAMETAIRNGVLAEHGLDPEVSTSTREKPVDFASMPKEEFDKWVAKATRR